MFLQLWLKNISFYLQDARTSFLTGVIHVGVDGEFQCRCIVNELPLQRFNCPLLAMIDVAIQQKVD